MQSRPRRALSDSPLRRAIFACAFPFAAVPVAAWADDSTSTTGDELSPICTDRPTKSNVACSVDQGQWQIESDLFNGSFQSTGGVTTDTYYATNPTLKYGLTKTVDLEVNVAPYEAVRTRDATGAVSTLGGVGDLFLRVKDNFYNSVDGSLSMAVIPYVKAPTARLGVGDGAWEGGVIAPVDYKLTSKLTLALAPELDLLKDADDEGRHVNTAQLINLSYSLPANLTVYGELWGDWNFDPAGTIRQYSADVAAAWGASRYLQLDAGLNFGLSRSTPGVQVYFGVSQKF